MFQRLAIIVLFEFILIDYSAINSYIFSQESAKIKPTVEKEIQDAIEMVKQDPLAGIALINALCREYKQYDKGIKELERIAQEFSNKPSIKAEALVNLQVLYLDSGNFKKGLELADEISKQYADTEHNFWSQGNIATLMYEKHNNWQKAENIYKKLIEKAEEITKKRSWMVWPYVYIGKNLYSQHKYDQAISQFRKGIDRIKKEGKWSNSAFDLTGEAQFMIGESYSKLGDAEKAKNAYKEVIEKYNKLPKWVEKAKSKLEN